ncbi:MAG TPA: YfhO family protein, partial [Elusimicrobiales bacterium]|nr:YfhO family protein [Elusimicrobiales bacterium]
CLLPALAVFLESRRLFPIARVISGSYMPQSGLLLSPAFENQGVPSRLSDLCSGWLPLTLTMSNPYSELPLYLTLPVFLLALLGILRGTGRGKTAFIVAGALSLWASLGAKFGFALFLGFIPGFMAARHMEMFMPFTVFSLAALAVYGFAYAADNYPALRAGILKRRFVWSMALVALYLCGALPQWRLGGALYNPLLYGLVAVWLLNLMLVRDRGTAFALLLCLIGLDAAVNHVWTNDRFFAPVPQPLAYYRGPRDFAYNERRQWAVPSLMDAAPLYREPFCNTFGEAFLFHKDSAFFTDNLRFFIPRAYYEFLGRNNIVTFWEQPGGPTPGWQERLGITADKARVSGGKVAIKNYGPDHAVFEVSAPRDGEFMYLDGYHPGWRASVDGKNVPVLMHDEVFKKVAVPKGSREVRFEFHAPLFRYGLLFY